MSRPRTPANLPIELDLSAAFDYQSGIGRAEFLQFAPRLEDARQRLLAEVNETPTHWLAWPRRLLNDHDAARHRSLLGRLFAAAKHLRDTVDRAVILASPQSVALTQALLAAGCHPYHNEQSRGERGGRPRIYLVPTKADNDALQGLLDILPHGRVLHTVDERWGIVAIDDGAPCELLTPLFGILWNALLSTAAPGHEADRAIAVGHADSPLMEFTAKAGCTRVELSDAETPTGIPTGAVYRQPTDNFSTFPAAMFSPVFHPGVLLAAAVMNIDVVQMLEGAAAIVERFRSAPPGDNPPLDLAGWRHLLAAKRGIENCAIDSDTAALSPLAWLYSTHHNEDGQALVQFLLHRVRRDRLRVTMPAGATPSGRTKQVDRYLPDIAAADAEAIRHSRSAQGQPTAVVRLPAVDEHSLGQLIQMLAIAAVVEA